MAPEEYIDMRIREVGDQLDLLQDHWDREMKFPMIMRRIEFLTFIHDERVKYEPLMKELITIKKLLEV